MKTTDNKITSRTLSATIDLEKKLPEKTKEDIGNYLKEQILLSVGEQKSPITGQSFPSLSPDYKKFKKAEVGNTQANLELTGSMLDSLDFKITKKGLEIGVFGKDAPKADGHNNLSGESSLPERRFIPEVGQGFKTSIEKEVEKIIADALAEEADIPIDELEAVTTPSDLYSVLSNVFEDMSRAEIRSTILRSPEWFNALDDLDLLDLL